MPTPVKPDKFARAAGFDPYDLTEAVQSGEDEFAGLPIGDWRQNGGEYLNLPDDYAEQIGISPTNGRSNPSQVVQQAETALAGTPDKPNWPEAARDAAPPVSANAGAAYAAGKFADTVREQPQVMEDFVDGAALLGSAGLAYATAEEGEVLKAGATAAGLFAAFKGIRYLCQQGDRQTDMAERQQRHQIHQQRQRQMDNGSQRRLSDSGVRVGGA
jgi:hypothetical protein